MNTKLLLASRKPLLNQWSPPYKKVFECANPLCGDTVQLTFCEEKRAFIFCLEGCLLLRVSSFLLERKLSQQNPENVFQEFTNQYQKKIFSGEYSLLNEALAIPGRAKCIHLPCESLGKYLSYSPVI